MSPTLLQPPGWARPRGYANGVAASGRMVFVAGQIGWDADARFNSDDLVAQTGQALRNVVAVLGEAGALPAHIVRTQGGHPVLDITVSEVKGFGRKLNSVEFIHSASIISAL